MYKTIFQLDDEDKLINVVNNVNNLLKDMESEKERIQIEILANGSGVKAFKKENEEDLKAIKDLLAKDVRIALCSNSLNKFNLYPKDLIDGIIAVKSGVGELTRRQNEGWAYIKP